MPVYLLFIGAFEPGRTAALISSAFAILVAFLMVSRLPVWSGKRLRVPGDHVTLMILGVVLFASLLFTYPWVTLSAGVIAYLIFLPLSARAYSERADREEAAAKLRSQPEGSS